MDEVEREYRRINNIPDHEVIFLVQGPEYQYFETDWAKTHRNFQRLVLEKLEKCTPQKN